jgi:hypothetical protein
MQLLKCERVVRVLALLDGGAANRIDQLLFLLQSWAALVVSVLIVGHSFLRMRMREGATILIRFIL